MRLPLHNYKKILVGTTLLLSLVLIGFYITRFLFVDEIDNFIGAYVVSSGGLVYKDFDSQHTPLMYYFLAPAGFACSGNIYCYRSFGYLLLALIWIFIYKRYQKSFGATGVIIYPLLYLAIMPFNDDVSHTIVADQFQAQFTIIILFELLKILYDRNVSYSNFLVVGVAAFCAIGVAFVSLFSICFFLAATLIVALKIRLSDRNTNVLIELRFFWGCFALFAAPFALFVLFSYATGTLNEMFNQAYLLNREVYSKYQAGFGSSIVDALVGRFKVFFDFIYFDGSFEYGLLKSGEILPLYNKIVSIGFAIYLARLNFVAAILYLLGVVYTTSRGFQGFHALPYWAVSAFITSFFLSRTFRNSDWKRVLLYYFILIICLVCVSIYKAKKIPRYQRCNGPECYEYYIKNLLAEDDRFFNTSIDTHKIVNIQTQRLPAIPIYAMVPWIYEFNGPRYLNKLADAKPKLIIFNPEDEVWGYKLADYAPGLVEYLANGYTELDLPIKDIYARNDLIGYFRSKLIGLDEDMFGYETVFNAQPGPQNIGEFTEGRLFEQELILQGQAYYRIFIYPANYQRPCFGSFLFKVFDSANNVLSESTVECSLFIDNKSFPVIEFAAQSPKAQTYKIVGSSVNGNSGSTATFWLSDIEERAGLTVDRVRNARSLAYKIQRRNY